MTSKDIDLFFTTYNIDRDSRLRFSEFTLAFLPLDVFSAQMLEARNANPEGYEFSEKTLALYRNLWLTHFKAERQAELIRERLENNKSIAI